MYLLSSIHSVNLQAHGDVYIELPRTGLVRFRGENSEGKSIITKVLNEFISGRISQPMYRNPLINYGETTGYLTLKTHTGKRLHLNIDRESSKTFVEYSDEEGYSVKRYLSDKNIPELVQKFGFHWNAEREISLNIYNTYDPLLFLNTSHRTNGDVLESAVTDPTADAAINGIDLSLQELEDTRKRLADEVRQNEIRLGSLSFYDIEHEQKRLEKLIYLGNNIQALETPDLPYISPIIDIEDIELLDTTSIRNMMSSIVFVDDKLGELLTEIDIMNTSLSFGYRATETDLSHHVKTMISYQESLENELCPTCGKSYMEDQHIHAVS